MNQTQPFLECTLQGGGDYNDWRFDKQLAIEPVTTLCHSCIDIIEVGRKTPISPSQSVLDGYFCWQVVSVVQEKGLVKVAMSK